MNVSVHLLKKTCKVSKNHNKTSETMKNVPTFNRNYDNTYESSRKIEHHTRAIINFGTIDMKNFIISNKYIENF